MGEVRVVITGLGVLAANAIGKDAFFEASLKGISGVKPISLFDTAEFKVKNAGEISNFSPEQFLGAKGLRTLDRSTKLVCSAAKLALDDACLEINEENTADAGVAIGDTLGSLSSICEFDTEAIKEGVRYVNPALFPNTVINSPAAQVAIKFNIQGFNATISTGFCASLDALNYAADFIRLKRAKFVLSGGVEELCLHTFIGFYKAGLMSGEDSNDGIILGEGSAILVLEDLESAKERKAYIYAEVLGYGMGPGSREGLNLAIQDSIEQSGLSADDIDYICRGEDSYKQADAAEAQALDDIFGRRLQKITVNSPKVLTGECYSASGSLQAAAAVAAIEKQKATNVLINAFGPMGSNASLVISKFRG